MSDDPYLRLRALVTGAGAYAGLTPDEAEASLNAATVSTAGDPMLTPDAFVARFTAQEFSACQESNDALVRQLMFRLVIRRDPLDLTGTTVQQGLAYLVSIGLLTSQRAAAIGAVPPGPLITPRQQIAWPNPRIWAADVHSARLMEG